jgi:hypothetical protein
MYFRAWCTGDLTNGRILLANCPEIPRILDVSWLAQTQESAFWEFGYSIRSSPFAAELLTGQVSLKL